jgi:hypothetical protein
LLFTRKSKGVVVDPKLKFPRPGNNNNCFLAGTKPECCCALVAKSASELAAFHFSYHFPFFALDSRGVQVDCRQLAWP